MVDKPLVGKFCLGVGWACFFWVTTGVTVIETYTTGRYVTISTDTPKTKLLNKELSLDMVLENTDLHEKYKVGETSNTRN